MSCSPSFITNAHTAEFMLRTIARVRPSPVLWRSLSDSTSAAKASLIRSFLTNKVELFKKLDADGSGSIDAQELKAALIEAGATAVTTEEATAIIRAADKDGNGTIEMGELATVLTKGTLFEGVIKR